MNYRGPLRYCPLIHTAVNTSLSLRQDAERVNGRCQKSKLRQICLQTGEMTAPLNDEISHSCSSAETGALQRKEPGNAQVLPDETATEASRVKQVRLTSFSR